MALKISHGRWGKTRLPGREPCLEGQRKGSPSNRLCSTSGDSGSGALEPVRGVAVLVEALALTVPFLCTVENTRDL